MKVSSSFQSVNVEDVRQAYERIADKIVYTPLMRVLWLEKLLGLSFPIYFKCENKQTTGSFKVRGAFNVLLQLTDEQKQRGIICRSSGNFAQAVSYVGQQLGIKVTVVMPMHAPQAKVLGAQHYGANIVLHGQSHTEGNAKRDELAKQYQYTMVHSYDSPEVIAGQGTLALEIQEQLEKKALGAYYCCIGGGGVMAGSSLVLKHFFPDAFVVAGEPEKANDFYLSMKKQERTEISPPSSIADGLLAVSVGQHNWPILKKNVDDVVLVSEADIKKTMALIVENMPNFDVEPSGALGVAAFIHHCRLNQEAIQGPVVCVLTGGNVDKDKFPDIYFK